MIDHDVFHARLDDHVDGLLDPADRAFVERHLAECGACRAEVDAIRALQGAARALPREIAPPRDLWAGIAARIAADAAAAVVADGPGERVEVIGIETGRRRQPAWWMRRDLLAAAGVVLALLSSAVTAALIRSGPAAPEGPAVVATGGAAAGVPGEPATALVAFAPAEQEIAGVVEGLVFALDAQRDRLDPATVRVVEENLRVIDDAIGEARRALEADPNNTDLTFLLMDVYRKKIDLLQNAVQIANL